MKSAVVNKENKTIVFGEFSLAVNPENILESIDALEKLETADWKKMADGLELPAVPFEKRLLKPVMMGEVQSAWYAAFAGGVPPSAETNQKARVARYLAQVEELKNADGKDLVTTRKKTADGDKPRSASLYRLVEAASEAWKSFKGQKRLIVKVFEQEKAIGPDGKGITVRTIADTVRDTEETKAPSDKNCAFHINAWGHEGVVERVEEKDGKWVVSEVQKPKGSETPVAAVPPPAKQAPQAPAKGNGKTPTAPAKGGKKK